MLNSPPWSRSFRDRSEGERWNFVERFLGEGIRLPVPWPGHLRWPPRALRPRRRTRKFGRIFAAHFDADDALLAAVEEELSEREAEWFRNQRGNQGRGSPAWTTRFEEYEEVQGVLFPTKCAPVRGQPRRRPPPTTPPFC